MFSDNSVETFPNGLDYGGGGAAIFGDSLNLESSFDRYLRNTVAGQPVVSMSESEGGGLYFSGADSLFYGFLTVVAGNTVGARGEGGGIYVGTTATTLELGEATIAGNSVGAGGQFAGVAGRPGRRPDHAELDRLQRPQPDIGGFDDFDVRYSDACNGGAAFSGPGNICADPKLVGGGRRPSDEGQPDDRRGPRRADHFGGRRAGADRLRGRPAADRRRWRRAHRGHGCRRVAGRSRAAASSPTAAPGHAAVLRPRRQRLATAPSTRRPRLSGRAADDNEGDETQGDLVLCG